MISSTPKARSREIVISSSVRPSSSTSAFGRSFVSGRSRVPRPAARTIAFIETPPRPVRKHRRSRESQTRGGSFREKLGLQLSQVLEPEVPDHYFDALFRAKVAGKLLRQKNRTVLAASATERHHEILEAPLAVIRDGGIHQGKNAGEELVHALLLIEIFDHRSVLAGQRLEAVFASGSGESAPVKHESAAISGFVPRLGLVKGEAENAHHQVVRFRSKTLQLFRSQHAAERRHERGQIDGQLRVVQQPANVLQRVRHALQEMRAPLVEAAKTICAERLENANVNVSVVVAQKLLAIERNVASQALQIMFQQVLANRGRQVRLGVKQKRRDIVLQSALSSALIVDEVRSAPVQHDVARLKIPVEKIVARRAQEEIREQVEIPLERVLV